eukprot:776334_1
MKPSAQNLVVMLVLGAALFLSAVDPAAKDPLAVCTKELENRDLAIVALKEQIEALKGELTDQLIHKLSREKQEGCVELRTSAIGDASDSDKAELISICPKT